MSDIDLATLQKNRLEERVHYKLSWWARRLSDKQKHLFLKNNYNVTQRAIGYGSAGGAGAGDGNGGGENGRKPKPEIIKKSLVNENSIIKNENCNNVNKHNGSMSKSDEDETFVTSKRRRSGTWP